jgi:hypothetical protein
MFSDGPVSSVSSRSNNPDGFESLWSTPWGPDSAAPAGNIAEPAPAPSPSNSSGRVLKSFFASDTDGYGDFSGGALEEED